MIFGEPSVDRLAARMTSEQITEWRAYYEISPWDLDRTEYLIASFMQLYASAHSHKGHKPKLEDFLLFLRKTDEQREQEEFDRFFEAHRG